MDSQNVLAIHCCARSVVALFHTWFNRPLFFQQPLRIFMSRSSNRVVTKQAGYTLIEVMIVVVIIALITMIAVPSYLEHTARARRAECKAFLLDVVSKQERFYTLYASYTTTPFLSGGCTGEACGLGYQDGGSGVLTSENGLCTVAIAGTNCDGALCRGFTLTGTPLTEDELCTSLTITNTGVRGATGTGTTEACWR